MPSAALLGTAQPDQLPVESASSTAPEWNGKREPLVPRQGLSCWRGLCCVAASRIPTSTLCQCIGRPGQPWCDALLCSAGYAISASLLEGVLSDGNGPLVSYPSTLFAARVSPHAAAELQNYILFWKLVKLTKMNQYCRWEDVKHALVSFRPMCADAYRTPVILQTCWQSSFTP